MGKAAVILAALLLASVSCQGLQSAPADGVFLSSSGTSLELQSGRCIRATISPGIVFGYGETPRTFSASSQIQTAGSFPEYQYSHTDSEASWIVSATFSSPSTFSATIYIDTGDTQTLLPDAPFQLQQL